MKTILVNIQNSFSVRNFLRTDALKIINNRPDIRLVLLADDEKINYYKKEFPLERIIFDRMPQAENYFFEKVFKFVETASIHTKTAAMIQKSEFYRSGLIFPKKFLSYFIKRIFWLLGRFRFWRIFLRKAYNFIPTKTFDNIFGKYKPNLVFCPSLLYSNNRLAKEAKKKNIMTIGAVLSWDNFYSKSLLRVHPDKLVAYTDDIKKQAEVYGDFPSERIVVAGLPQYDRYFKRLGVVSRELFFRSVGADLDKKLIIYAFSGKAGFHIDFGIVEILLENIKNGRIRNAQVLLRPYPRYDFSQDKIEKIKKEYNVLVCPSMSHIGAGKDSWEFDEKSLDFLTNTLAHADIIINMYSTFFIEGAIFDKPLIGIAFDGGKKSPYYQSARRFFDWDHLERIKLFNGIDLVHNEEEFIKSINRYLANTSCLNEGRKKIVEVQSQFTDGKSGERLAKVLLKILNNKNV